MEKLVLGKYLDIFSSLIGWAHVLLKQCVVKQLPACERLETGEEAELLWAQQLHWPHLEALHLKQEERFPRKTA